MSPGEAEVVGSGEPLATDAVYTEANIPPYEGSSISLFCDRCGRGVEAEHEHDELQLSLIFEPGVCDYTWRDAAGEYHEEHVVGPQFLLVAPRVRHSCCWQQESDAVILYIEADLRESLLPDGTLPFVCSSSIAGASSDMVVWQLAAALRQIRTERKEPDTRLLHSVAVTVADRALKMLGGELALGAPGAPKLSPERTRAMDAYIEANLGVNFPIADLARKVGLSVPHFTALCRATVRMSPMKYIRRRRMLKALEMLKSGNHRVAEVALALGFMDQGYFTARFKEFFSFTPRSVLLSDRLEPAECPNKP